MLFELADGRAGTMRLIPRRGEYAGQFSSVRVSNRLSRFLHTLATRNPCESHCLAGFVSRVLAHCGEGCAIRRPEWERPVDELACLADARERADVETTIAVHPETGPAPDGTPSATTD